MTFDHLGLPESVTDFVDTLPMEDIGLALLREVMPDLSVMTQFPNKPRYPSILVRGYANQAHDAYANDDHLDSGIFAVHVIADDPNGDERASVISLAIRQKLRLLWPQRYEVGPGMPLVKITCISRPRRVPDWNTSTGPVQYAELPQGVWRYETLYRVTFRKKH